MPKPKRPKKVEVGLRLDDFIVLRSAARTGRAAMLARLQSVKSQMQQDIRALERLDDTLVRLDVAIATAEAAYSSTEPAADRTQEDGG